MLIIVDSSSLSSETLWHKLYIFVRVACRAGQWRRICSKEPSDCGGQPGRRQYPALFVVQWRCSRSVRYLPDNIRQVIPALWHSKGLAPQDVQIGCRCVRDMYSGLKYGAYSRLAASARSFNSQWLTTFDLISLSKVIFVSGSCRRVMGWGSW